MQSMYGLLIYIFIVGAPDPIVQFVSPVPIQGTAGLFKSLEQCEEYAAPSVEYYENWLADAQKEVIAIGHSCFDAKGLMVLTKKQKAVIESNGSF